MKVSLLSIPYQLVMRVSKQLCQNCAKLLDSNRSYEQVLSA